MIFLFRPHYFSTVSSLLLSLAQGLVSNGIEGMLLGAHIVNDNVAIVEDNEAPVNFQVVTGDVYAHYMLCTLYVVHDSRHILQLFDSSLLSPIISLRS